MKVQLQHTISEKAGCAVFALRLTPIFFLGRNVNIAIGSLCQTAKAFLFRCHC